MNVCVYVWMCMDVCMDVYGCVCVCMDVCMDVYGCVWMCVDVCGCVCTMFYDTVPF